MMKTLECDDVGIEAVTSLPFFYLVNPSNLFSLFEVHTWATRNFVL